MTEELLLEENENLTDDLTDDSSDDLTDLTELTGAPDVSDPEARVRVMAEAAAALRATEIVVLDLRPLTIIADFFLICTGKSSIHIRSITDRIEEAMRNQGYRKLRTEGYQEATWILLDYGDVVVHVMAEEQREFYRLEEFWAAAPRLELEIDID